jgi:hypothetical protein
MMVVEHNPVEVQEVEVLVVVVLVVRVLLHLVLVVLVDLEVLAFKFHQHLEIHYLHQLPLVVDWDILVQVDLIGLLEVVEEDNGEIVLQEKVVDLVDLMQEQEMVENLIQQL